MPETTPNNPYDSASHRLRYSHFSDEETETHVGDLKKKKRPEATC